MPGGSWLMRLRDGRLHVLRRRVDVAVEGELHGDRTSSPARSVDVMLSMPAMVENCFSSGVATADAMVSGLAPGRLAFTVIVG